MQVPEVAPLRRPHVVEDPRIVRLAQIKISTAVVVHIIIILRIAHLFDPLNVMIIQLTDVR